MIKLGMKIAVIALFVLAGAALTMGILLFQQREMLKGRTQKLETAIKQVAATIEAGDATEEKMVIPDDQLKTYKQKPGGPAPMDSLLSQVALRAQEQLTRLNGTRSMLAETKTTLAKTEGDLKKTQADLATANGTIGKLNETVTAKNATIEERDTSISRLEREKGELAAQVTEIKAQKEELEKENSDLTEAISERDQALKKMELARGPSGKPELTRGQQGQVLYVDPDWNFLIIGMGTETQQKIGPDVELLIQRADRLVGKVCVKAVENNMAIADILNDWQQFPPRKGDYVIY